MSFTAISPSIGYCWNKHYYNKQRSQIVETRAFLKKLIFNSAHFRMGLPFAEKVLIFIGGGRNCDGELFYGSTLHMQCHIPYFG